MTEEEYDTIARTVQLQISRYSGQESPECLEAYSALLGLAARLCIEFKKDPGFNRYRFLSILIEKDDSE